MHNVYAAHSSREASSLSRAVYQVTVSVPQQFTNKLGVEALDMSTSLLKHSSN